MYIIFKIVLFDGLITRYFCTNVIGPLPAVNYNLINRTRARIIKLY